MRKISLQINLAPVDYVFSKHILSHQLKKLVPLFDEVVLIVDYHKSKGRFAGVKWEENRIRLEKLLNVVSDEYSPGIKMVDYSVKTQKKLSAFYTNGRVAIPFKDNRGGPYYSYLFGLLAPVNDYIFHLDSDILLMGDPKPWIGEALAILEDGTNDYIVCCPASSPFHPASKFINGLTKEFGSDHENFTTRFFFINRKELQSNFRRKLPPFDRVLNAILKGNPVFQAPEKSLELFMKRKRLKRIEFPGKGNFIALHPATRSDDFIQSLPQLINLMDQGIYPEEQIGDHDITDAYIKLALQQQLPRFDTQK